MSAVRLALAVDVDAPVEDTWRAAVDWDHQGDWMLATTVRETAPGRLEAFTGLGPVGFRDTMEITGWDPPYRCEVLHTGRLVRGSALFLVEARPDGGSRFRWEERLDLPLGLLGRIGWLLLRPLFAAGVAVSLRRFARSVPRGRG